MSDRKDFNDAAKVILAAAEKAVAAKEAEAAGKRLEGPQTHEIHSILADDTLGRLIQYCMPFFKKWGPRYGKVFATLVIVFIPLKFRQQYLRAGVPWEQFARWLDANEPMILPKIIGVAALVAGWVVMAWLAFSVERQRRLRKHPSKSVETGIDASFNSQS